MVATLVSCSCLSSSLTAVSSRTVSRRCHPRHGSPLLTLLPFPHILDCYRIVLYDVLSNSGEQAIQRYQKVCSALILNFCADRCNTVRKSSVDCYGNCFICHTSAARFYASVMLRPLRSLMAYFKATKTVANLMWLLIYHTAVPSLRRNARAANFVSSLILRNVFQS